jgi:proteasome accessory factor B
MADRVERLTNLLALLLEAREPLTLHVIAAELGGQYPDSDQARRASFERDKAALREIGVEISSVTLGGDRAGEMGYWVDRATYELPDLGLEPDEVRALQVALAMVRPDSAVGEEALWKLGGVAGGVGGPVRMHLPELEALPVLRQAVAERHPVEFRYSGDERVVEPWGVLLRDGFWYLVGHDRMRAARRTFRIDRIEGEVSVLDDVIVDPPGDVDGALPSDPLLLGAPEHSIREAVVRIGARRAATVVAEVGSDRVQAVLADGGVEVVVRYASEVAMRSWVLGHLEDAVVIEPADLRESVVAWLEGCAR